MISCMKEPPLEQSLLFKQCVTPYVFVSDASILVSEEVGQKIQRINCMNLCYSTDRYAERGSSFKRLLILCLTC